ncbi:MAG: dephospho-CoA kinase [Acidimicrobiia bacterium]
MTPSGNPPPQLRILVLGGIGSGKTTVTGMFGARGAVVISADEVGHEILAPGGSAHDEVGRRWPMTVIEGRIDRRALAAVVFPDQEQLRELEGMTHPHIRDAILERAAAADPRPVVVELPLIKPLFGPEWVRVLVEAGSAVRLERVTERGGDPGDTRARMAVQPGRAEWRAIADHVIVNDAGLAELRVAADAVWDEVAAGR